MKPIENYFKTVLIICLVMTTCLATAQVNRTYYAVEIDGVLCGYSTQDIEKIKYNGQDMVRAIDSVHLLLKVLGQDMNPGITSVHIYDPENYKMAFNNTIYNIQEGQAIQTSTEIFEDYALYLPDQQKHPDTIEISEGLIFDNSVKSSFIMEDFDDGKTTEKSYKIFDYMKGRVTDQHYTFVEKASIELAENTYEAMVFDVYNKTDGTSTRMWIDNNTGLTIQFTILNRKIYLSKPEVIKKISTVDLDNTIFARVDQNIPGFMDMTYAKVKAELRSAGEEITVESLNFPGQKFEGTVVDNHIKGVFVIEPIRYDGSNAPPFPPSFDDEGLKKYIEPELFIESDHPDIIAKAEEITAGATDSWDAAVRLSTWVGKEISGAVPGGTTAIGTLTTREGECGSHSRLLTGLCRAVGIPSRLSIGCMYSPWYGGSFGQHAWTEVYMGEEAGWVAVDATILEYDYVDAGHIKFGVTATFHPVSMEIIEYRLSDEAAEKANINDIPEEYKDILGPYTNPRKREVLDVQYVAGTVSVDILGRIMLALKEPDEEGRMYAQLSDKVYFKFTDDGMIVAESIYAMKKLDEEIPVAEDVPEEYKSLIGPYVVFQIKREFTVVWHDGGLSMMVPDVKDPRPLEKKDGENHWKDPVDLKEYMFEINEDGTVGGMSILATSIFDKGATAAWIIDKTIEKEGMEAAEEKFWELWNNRALDIDHTEGDLNRLGYKYLGEEKIDEALMVFKLNVEAYPQSWNVYGSYGEALVKNGQAENAIEYFQKSVELNPDNERGLEMLEELTTTNE